MGVGALASQAAGCFFRGDLLILQRFQDAASLLARLVAGIAWGNAGVIIATGGKAHGAEDVIQAGADRGIRDPKLRFNILDDAAVLDEDLDEGELFRRETLEATQVELSLDLRLAIAALQPGDVQLVATDGAAAQDWVRGHEVCRETEVWRMSVLHKSNTASIQENSLDIPSACQQCTPVNYKSQYRY